jgi:septum formation protein
MDKELILASGSPRRHEILAQAGLAHRILTAPADEKSVAFRPGNPEEYVKALAELKNDAVFEKYGTELGNAVILSADTVVWSAELQVPLGKPGNEENAVRMLRQLSGRTHEVITGVMLRDTESGRESVFSETTEVIFRELDDEEILRYARSGDPFDKAGAYGIQSGACVFVRGIRGDYFNVVGLPVCRVSEELKRLRRP